jgi:1-aminocyclopropane-1-carboxylate deaminase
MLKQHCLENKVKPLLCSNFHLTSRCHRLISYDTDLACCYVKREDELSFGISGSKWRKYASLICSLSSRRFPEVALVGSPFSNHVLSMAQLCKEYKIPFQLFLQGPPPEKCVGNFFFLSLVSDPSQIIWLAEIPLSFTLEWTSEIEKRIQKRFTWIPVGASAQEAMPGALTLAFDILKNEEAMDVSFDHIFVDAGTGMIAASLILGFHSLLKKTKVHVVQVGGRPEDFVVQLQQCHLYFEEWLQEKIEFPCNYELHVPASGKSFGALNATLIKEIVQMARKEGIFLDPLYNAKLFLTGKKAIQNQALKGNILIIHSGGALSLSGFQDQIANYL